MSNQRLIALAGLCVLLVIGALMVPVPFHGRLAVATGDLVHGPLFAAISLGTMVLLQKLRPLGPTDRGRLFVRCLGVFVLLSGFGLATELAQMLSGRTAAKHDAIADSLGVAAALLLYVGWNRRQVGWHWQGCLALAIGLMLMCWYRPAVILLDVWRVKSEFPQLCSFESDVQLSQWYMHHCHATVSDQFVTHGHRSMRVDFERFDYPTTTLIEFPGDWQEVTSLHVDVTLAPDSRINSVPLAVNVHDRKANSDQENHYRKVVALKPGKTIHLAVSRAEMLRESTPRQLDLSDIQYVSLTLLHPTQVTTVYVDDLRLELSPSRP